jgi:2-keto-4-pentenoate hydratase/2-oxohepta-3-ene-1,7-dioic acid hydratase in catechol pathway
MHFVTFLRDGVQRPGLASDGAVRALPERFTTLIDYIASSPAPGKAVDLGPAIPLESVTLLAPLKPHKNVFCVGRNYLGHAEESARASGTELKLPPVPTFFTKAPTAIAAPGATLHFSSEVSQKYDWEAELAVVIGKRCRDVREEDALGVVFGYTCLNDVTARDLQSAHLQWFKGKSLDDACPLGPWVVGAQEIADPQALRVTLRLNGEIKQDGNTATMIFPVAKIIASLSRGMTLEPGDIIATGTPDGVGFARTPPEFLQDGDVMEVEIERIGVLRNTVSLKR